MSASPQRLLGNDGWAAHTEWSGWRGNDQRGCWEDIEDSVSTSKVEQRIGY